MRQRDLIRAVARVWRTDPTGGVSAIVGTALLVSPRHVLTCAHVVTEALGLGSGTREAPRGAVCLDFPASAPGKVLRSRVVVWYGRVPSPSGRYDIAGLALEDALPEGATAAPLTTPQNLWCSCRAFGFPAGRPDGSYAEGTLKDVLANGWVMIRGGADAREFARPGYSGGPVYTEQGVVGMLTEGDHEGRVREAVMIPTEVLLTAWPELYRLNTTCPYRGLASFRAEDARFFRGREEVSQRLAAAVAAPPFFAVLAGASGSGKSSVIEAGVVPQLRGEQPGALLGSPWQVAALHPGAAPFKAFAHTLLTLWQPELTGTARLRELTQVSARLDAGELRVADVVGDVLRRQPAGTRLLLAVDQSEELFTQRPVRDGAEPASLGESDTTSRRFLEGLQGALEHPELGGRVSLLMGIRTDFLDHLLGSAATKELHRCGVVHYLGAVERLRDVIEAPLEVVGLGRLEPGLTERILQDVEGEPNPLPLLEFTLTELWHRQHGGTLSHAAYDELGGVARALATYAQGAFEQLSPAEQRQAKEVFLQLMQPVDGPLVTRRVASLAELGDEKRPLVKLLADKHLVVTGRSPDQPDTAEVVHEALFEHWPLLRGWVQEGWAFRRWQEGLRAALREWLEGARHPDYLLQGAKLAVAEGYLSEQGGALSEPERAFIREGLEHRAARGRAETARLLREARVQRLANRILSAFLAVALLLSAVAAWQWNRAERQTVAVSGLNTRLEVLNADLTAASRRSEEHARSALANKLSAQGLLATQNPGPTNGDPRLGALLAAQAVATEDNVQSRGNLLRVVQSEPVPASERELLSALSPDGTLLAAVSLPSNEANRTEVLLWELPERRRRHAIVLEASPSALAFSPDGGVLAVGLNGRGVRVFDTATGEPLGEALRAHDYPVVGLTFSLGGAQLLSSEMDGTLLLWDLASRQVVGRVARQELEAASAPTQAASSLPFRRPVGQPASAEHRDWLKCVVLSPDGRVLALADQEGAVRLLDAETLRPLGPPLGAGGARSLAFSPDGARLAVGDREGAVQVWEVATQRPSSPPLQGLKSAVRSLAFSPDGEWLATADAAGTILLRQANDPRVRVELTLGADTVHRLFFTQNDLYISGREGSRAAFWQVDLAAGTPEVKANVRVTWEAAQGTGLWDVLGGSSLSSPLLGALDSYAVHILHAPDGERFVTRSSGRQAQLWDAVTREPLGPPIGDQAEIEGVAFSPDGSVLATGSRDGRIILRDAETGAALGEPLPLDLPCAVSLAFSPDGKHLAVGTEGWVVVWDLEQETLVGEPAWDTPSSARMDLVESLAYSPDGNTLIGTYDRFVYVWDAHTLQLRGARLPGMAGDRKVRRVLVSPGGGVLMAVYNDGDTAALWNLDTLELITVLNGVSGTAFSPDGKLLVTGGWRSLTFWDAATLEPLGEPIPTHTSEVNALSFGRDGRTLISSAVDNTVLVWQVDLPSWLQRACARAERNLTGPEWSRYLGTLPYTKTCPEHPVDASAADLLLSQAERAAAEGDEETARTLYGRALDYAREADLSDVLRRICRETPLQLSPAELQTSCDATDFAQGRSDAPD